MAVPRRTSTTRDVRVGVSCRVEGVRHPLRALSVDARRLARRAGIADLELSIVLAGDPFVRGLNRAWRGKDVPTDVLSFPGAAPVLGDIVISLDTARRQAEALGHAVEVELRVLLVHGLCHLLGLDHVGAAATARMHAKESELLASLVITAPGLVGRATGLPAGPVRR